MDAADIGFEPPPHLPAAVRTVTAGAAWLPLGQASGGIQHHELRWVDGRAAHVASGPPDAPGAGAAVALADELERLAWFAAYVPVPEVLAFATGDDGTAFLVTTGPPGSPATGAEHGGDASALVVSVAEGLTRFHTLPVADCPFVLDTATRIERARQRVAAGAVVQQQLPAPYRRYSPQELFDLMVAAASSDADDPVVAHGAYTLEHVHLDAGRVTGYTGLARAGVSDRYVDLAVAAQSLARVVSPEALGPFFDAYGIALPDVRKVDFYVLLDAFF